MNTNKPLELDIVTTTPGNSYWDENGKYQAEYNELYQLLVPDQGAAKNLFGEVIRAASRLSWDYYNNGNMNACFMTEIEGDWVGDDEDGYQEDSDWEISINPYYEKFLELLRQFFIEEMPQAIKIVNAIKAQILRGDDCNFSKEEERPYVLLMDAVCYIICSKAETVKEAAERSPELYSWYEAE
jgi:hypothetical protein